jgi:3',5'-cyclic-AMP phosphodiesterase
MQMIIAQISDSHIDPEHPNGADRIRDLERCVADINRLNPLPDAVIHTGDLAHDGTPEKYQEVARILGSLRCPLHVAAGNRDDRRALRTAFPADGYLLPDTDFMQYAIEGYPVRLIAVDTQSENGNQGDFCEIRANSLRAALVGNETPTAIFMHHPPFEISQSDYPFQFQSREAAELLTGTLDGLQHVVRIFCGHSHRDATGRVGDVPASTNPSVAIDLRLGEYPDGFQTAPLYQIHRFDARDGFVSEIRAAA